MEPFDLIRFFARCLQFVGAVVAIFALTMWRGEVTMWRGEQIPAILPLFVGSVISFVGERIFRWAVDHDPTATPFVSQSTHKIVARKGQRFAARQSDDDELIFAGNGVTITPSQLTAYGASYDVGEIKSAKFAYNEAALTLLIICGGVVFSVGIILAIDGEVAGLIPAILGGGSAGYFVYRWARLSDRVVISFTSGKKLAIPSSDKTFLKRIHCSIKKAIRQQRRRQRNSL
jgi:hypothetical protein